MQKKNLIFFVGLLALSHLHVGWAQTQKVPRELLKTFFKSSDLDPFLGSIEGEVYFEKRYTKVTHEGCEVGICPQSQAYWSVLVRVGDASYLVNQRFGLGHSRAPQEVELAGVALKEGMMIRLDGMIHAYASDSFMVSEVTQVSLLRELGWACHDSGSGERTVFARVWQDPIGGESSSYRLRVHEVRSRRARTLADVNQMTVSAKDQLIVFEGQSRNPQGVRVQLRIQNSQQSFRNLPAQLTLLRSRLDHSPQDLEWGESLQMSCSRTRS